MGHLPQNMQRRAYMTVGGVSLGSALYVADTNAIYEKQLNVNHSEEKTFAETAKASQDDIVRPLQSAAVSAQEIFGNITGESSGSRQVYEALLARENATTGTTESDLRLAEIKIGANAKAGDERAERTAFFDTTFLAQQVKSDREFLAGKQTVGANIDMIQ